MSRWLPDVLEGPKGKTAISVAEYWWSYRHWYIDSSAGNDHNSGSAPGAGFALATTEELSRRLAVPVPIDHPVTVHVAQGSYGTLAVRVVQTATGCPFDVVGEVAYTDIGTVTSYADRVAATNTASHLVATGVSDWNPYIGKRIDILDGASAGAVAWVAKANPHSLGVDVARVSRFSTPCSGSAFLPSAVSPASGSSVAVATLPSLTSVQIRIQSGVDAQDASFVDNRKAGVFNLVATKGVRIDADGALVDCCDVADVMLVSLLYSRSALTRSRLSGLAAATSMNLVDVQGFYVLVQSPTSTIVRLYRSGLSFCLVQASSVVGWEGNLYDVGVFDRAGTADAVSLSSSTPRCMNATVVYGQGNARAGMSLAVGGTIHGASGNYITGSLGDLRIVGQAAYVPWSAVPWIDGERSGEATLVAGTVDVTVPYVLSTQKITACAKTFGGTPGFLSAFNVNSTTIRITSSSATDTSIVTWHILPTGDNAVVRS